MKETHSFKEITKICIVTLKTTMIQWGDIWFPGEIWFFDLSTLWKYCLPENVQSKNRDPVKCETKQKQNGTKRNRSKRKETNRNETDRNETNQIETKRNRSKRNETKQIETKRNKWNMNFTFKSE